MRKSLTGLAAATITASGFLAAAPAEAGVYVHRTYRVAPVYPRVGYHVRAAYGVPGVRCVWRTTRVLVNGRYVVRRVRSCI